MLGQVASNRMKAKRTQAIWSKYFEDGSFGMIVNTDATVILVKSQKTWRAIDLEMGDFEEKLDEFIQEIKDHAAKCE